MNQLLEKLRDLLAADLAEARFYRRRAETDQSKEVGDPEREFERASLQIFIGALPPRKKDDDSLYPFLILQPHRMRRKSEGDLYRRLGRVRIILGLASEEPETGMLDLVSLSKKIELALTPATKLANRYTLEEEFELHFGDPREEEVAQIMPHYMAWIDLDWSWSGLKPTTTPAEEAEIYGEGFKKDEDRG